MSSKATKIPIILYEETLPGDPINPIPYIEVGLEEEMPKVLFVSEYKQTNETENGSKGPIPVVNILMHGFVNMTFLKNALDSKTNDKVRVALGLQPLREAKKHGKKIMDRVHTNASARIEQLNSNATAREERAFKLLKNEIEKTQKLNSQLDKLESKEETK